MPGAAWPWKKMTSPSLADSPSLRPRKKWLKPTSYSVAADAKVEMCPPIPSSALLARTTMAAAFQRTRLLMRRSRSGLPGMSACSSAEMVLM